MHCVFASELRRIRGQCKYMCYSFMMMACAGSACTMMKPFLHQGSENGLPYSMWTPLDITRSHNYWFMFGYEAIAIYTMSVVHAGIDCFFYAVFASIHYEISVLGHRLCELGHHHEAEKPIEHDIDKYDEIVELIRIHVQIDEFVQIACNINGIETDRFVFVCRNIQDCQYIFNTILFIQVVQTVVGLSFTSFTLLHVSVGQVSHPRSESK